MIGAAIGAATTIASGLLSSSSARKQRQRQRAAIQAEMTKNQNWYDRRYNEDATQRADAMHLINRTEESIKKRNKAAAGTAAVMGGSPEAAAAARAQNNEAISNTIAQIVANADARKDTIEQQYRERDAELNAQMAGVNASKTNSGMLSSALQAVGGVAAEYFGGNPGEEEDKKNKIKI